MSINMCGTAQTATSRSDRCRVPGTPVRQRTDGAHRTDYNRGFSLMHRKYNMQQHHNIPHARHALTSLTLAVLGALRRNQGPPRDHRPDRPGKDIGHWQGRIDPGHQAGGLQGRAPDRRPGHLPACSRTGVSRSKWSAPADRLALTMLNMHDQAVSAHPAIEDWDAMMRALRQRIGTVAAARPATLSSAQRQDRLSHCALALAQLGCHLGRVDATPTAKRQRELELKQAGRLLASARHATVDGAGPAGPDPATPAAPARTATRA